ncbi:lipopolysaccharide biosynthesis protein [Polaribacter uvawellassae]|uniref:lipopolysaccharide biosynthesis protein n=1 Tax=Polaribacter uvawellassae TaxID=3133495 RepID=UPI003218F435
MGIVLNQSFKNTIITFAAFGIGGVNALFLYTNFLTDEYYGLVTYLLSTANLLMPLTAFGVQYSIVKFFSSYTSKLERDKFLSSSLIFPLIIALPFGFLGSVFYEQISNYLSIKNPIIKDFTWIIYLVAIATAYFEIFYAWAKVQMQSVFGNVLKEMFSRIAAMILLILVYLEVITQVEFIYYLTGAYFIRAFVMLLYALKLYTPIFTFQLPENYKEVFKYASYIILAGSAGAILLDIDKFMIPQKEAIAYTAYYAVGVYIASLLEAPGRSMAQIIQPITAKALNENNATEIHKLYKSTSINLLLICGLFFLLINLNINQGYLLIDEKYSGGIWVVLMISIAKLYTMALGNNGAIISNSKHYKILLPYSIGMALSVYFLNDWFIDLYGMNGAALSTLIVLLFFNTVKIWYVKKKFNIQPFTIKTIYLLFVLGVVYGLFFFWDFKFHPIINIGLKSILITLAYLVIIYKLNISSDINTIINRLIKSNR